MCQIFTQSRLAQGQITDEEEKDVPVYQVEIDLLALKINIHNPCFLLGFEYQLSVRNT